MRWMLGAGLVVGAALVGSTAEGRQRPDLGQLDTSFNPDARLTPPGTVVDELLLAGEVGGLALQPGGKIVGAEFRYLESIPAGKAVPFEVPNLSGAIRKQVAETQVYYQLSSVP